MRRTFVDTSAWYAFFRANDAAHGDVRAAMEGARGRLVTSNHVFDEVVTLVRARQDHGAAVKAGAVLLDATEVDLVVAAPEDEAESWRLFCDRGDKEYSFTDCTSFAIMRRLAITDAVALDGHFRQEGFEVQPAVRRR